MNFQIPRMASENWRDLGVLGTGSTYCRINGEESVCITFFPCTKMRNDNGTGRYVGRLSERVYTCIQSE